MNRRGINLFCRCVQPRLVNPKNKRCIEQIFRSLSFLRLTVIPSDPESFRESVGICSTTKGWLTLAKAPRLRLRLRRASQQIASVVHSFVKTCFFNSTFTIFLIPCEAQTTPEGQPLSSFHSSRASPIVATLQRGKFPSALIPYTLFL